MRNKEKVYDKKISPLMKKIIDICKKEKIPMFAEFQFSNDDYCTTCIPDKKNQVWGFYQAVSQCKQEFTMNIDKLLLWVIKNKNVEQSMFLNEHNVN